MMKLSIVGLGPGPYELITQEAIARMREADIVYVQTERHKASVKLLESGICTEFLDDLYQGAEDFDDLNRAIVQRILECGRERIVFAVSGQGVVGQSAVPMLLQASKERGIETAVCPGIGYEAAISACGLDAANGYAVHIGAVFAETLDGGKINVVADIDGKLKASEAKIALMRRYGDDLRIYLVQADAQTLLSVPVPLSMLDRQENYDASMMIVVPPVPLTSRDFFTAYDLMEICRILRAPDGCPWDREQTHLSIRRNMLEEACEAMAAISEGDDEHLCEELGDVMLQVALHAVMAEDEGSFDFTGIATGICQKMIRRHPHIFGDVEAETSEQVLQNWEEIKKRERNGAEQNPMRKVGEGLPSLMRAQEMQKKLPGQPKRGISDVQAALADLADAGNAEKREKLAGRLLWQICQWLLQEKIHAETALCDTCMEMAEIDWQR